MRTALLGGLALALAACSVLPTPPARPATYDFGPGLPAAAPAVAPLRTIALDDVDTPTLTAGSTAVLYRLAYTDAQQLKPYTLARWAQPPAVLVHQRLREQLGQRRAVLRGDEALAQSRKGSAAGGALPVLRIEVEEFSQVFASATESMGVLRARATLVELTPNGEQLRGQKVFHVSIPATTADAVGGVRALSQSVQQLASDLDVWLEQVAR